MRGVLIATAAVLVAIGIGVYAEQATGDSTLTVIVVANGTGRSNLYRAPKLLRRRRRPRDRCRRRNALSRLDGPRKTERKLELAGSSMIFVTPL